MKYLYYSFSVLMYFLGLSCIVLTIILGTDIIIQMFKNFISLRELMFFIFFTIASVLFCAASFLLWEQGNKIKKVECRDSQIKKSFIDYIKKHPDQRFWQALRNWSNASFIYKSNELIQDKRLKDTFYLENSR